MKRSLAASLLALTTSLISSAAAQAQNCGTDAQVYVNASDTLTAFKPFQLPFGPNYESSETWTWTLDTVSYNMQGPNGSAEQRLFLSTQAQVNLTAPDFGFLGCGMILHGLRHGTIVSGQNDKGDCSTIFDSTCLRALDNSTNLTSQSLSPLAGNGNALDLCGKLANLGADGKYGLPEECSSAFLDDAWIQTFVIASPQIEDICSPDPGAGSEYDPIAAWGAGSYSTGDMTTYNNLTTSVTPLIVSLFTNRTVNDTKTSQDYTGQQMLCLRPSIIEAGSVSPSSIPNGAISLGERSSWAVIAGAFGAGFMLMIS